MTMVIIHTQFLPPTTVSDETRSAQAPILLAV
jgi:hypothetical protein